MAVQPAVTPGPEGSQAARPESILSNRWTILFFSVVSMVAVANFQYGWTLFVQPLQKQLKADAALIQVTFTVFVLLETWLVPFEGWLVDKFGPRLLVMLGGVLAGLGWVLSAKAGTVTQLYLSYAVAGIGAGIVYGTAIGSALKWFPEHRGLAAGLTAAGFGAGSALTVIPLSNMITSAGYQATFVRWGIIQGAVVVIAAFFLKAPPEGWLPKTWRSKGSDTVRTRQAAVSFTSGQMFATRHFWLMYFMMTMVATGGLMATAQLAPMAKDFKVADVPVNILGWTVLALPFALAADRVINGLCRPFWGWVSDHIGREKTMSLAFGLEAIAIYLLISFANRPLLFIIFSAFTFFGWAEIYSLFPALCGDFFGRKHATENYGFLYTAKGTASVFVPIGSALAAGKAFDFRADILLLIGGILVIFAVFLAPTVFRMKLGAGKGIILAVAGAIITYGLVLTVWPNAPTALLQAKFTMPKWGWTGVFKVAIVFDLIAAVLAFFVLRNMKAPALPEAAATEPGAKAAA
ncbi:MAG TPA: oxalate/formate MFS antiporter [Candidatus Angelobacter sp.]|nr:oxalate/formate MFS antiporter [Candidatus Angelobacter sp.]